MADQVSSNREATASKDQMSKFPSNAHLPVTHVVAAEGEEVQLSGDDDELAQRMGHKSEFAREFKSLSTISFAFSIMGLVSSVATTFNSPYQAGGPTAVVWAWFMGACFNLTLGSAIGELVSAYPSAGGLYSAAGLLVPRRWAPLVAWVTGWLNFTGQIAGIAGTAWGLSSMLWAYAYVANGYVPAPQSYESNTGAYVGLYIALMVIHGAINCFPNRYLARFTSSYVFINLGATVVTAIVCLARTPSDEMLSSHEAVGNLQDLTGWGSKAMALFVGLQSVQFVMTDYDASAHMSEDIARASFAAPVAIFVAVVGTGLFGLFLNIALVYSSGGMDLSDADSMPGGLIFAQILRVRATKVGFLIIWPFIMATAWFVIQTALQANARSFYAFSRDGGLPDRKFFAKVSKHTKQPVNSVWLVVFLCIILIFLAFASRIAVEAIFSLSAVAMDTSYLIPIICRQIFQHHPQVNFQPGPFYLGSGILSRIVNGIAIVWTSFEVTVLCFPVVRHYDASTFNYSWVVALGVLLIAMIWYAAYAWRTYHGPISTLHQSQLEKLGVVDRNNDQTEATEATEVTTSRPQSSLDPNYLYSALLSIPRIFYPHTILTLFTLFATGAYRKSGRVERIHGTKVGSQG